MHSFLNHITVDLATGDLWVAGHADLKMLFKDHTKPPHTAPSPSQVQRPRLTYYVREERGREDGGRRDEGLNGGGIEGGKESVREGG